MFEELYPLVAVAYGTFGICFGVLLWWKTQRRIDRTKSAIEIQVANAVKDISGKVDSKLGDIKMPDLAPVMAKLDDISELEVPEFDFSPVISRFDALEQTLPDTISSHIDMHMKALRAAEAKNIGKMVDELNIEGLTEEARTEAIERLSTKQKLAYQLMTMKVPKTVKGDHPLSTALFEQSRGTIAQYLIELDDQASGKIGAETISKGSFGVR